MVKLKTSFFSFIILLMFISGCHKKTQIESPGHNVKPIIMIVHGAWGGSWAFKQVEALLRGKGYDVYRPSLTGQGERVHLASSDINLNTHIKDVVNVFLYEELKDVILVGHSYGGMVVTGVADSIPERIKQLIYVDAFVPKDGESVENMNGEINTWLMQMKKGDYLIPTWVKPDQKPPKDVPHPLGTITERIVLDNALTSKIPSCYILTVDSGKAPEEDGFARHAQRAKERGWPVEYLQSDHNPQWSAPNAFIEMLDRISLK